MLIAAAVAAVAMPLLIYKLYRRGHCGTERNGAQLLSSLGRED